MMVSSIQETKSSSKEGRTHLRNASINRGGHGKLLRRCLYASLLQAVEGDATTSLKVLDIGSGCGELMGLLAQRGHDPTGIDVESECVQLSAAQGRALVGGFSELHDLFNPGEFDVIVSSHVLEHVDSPANSLNACRRLNASRYVFAVPNVHRCARIVRLVLGNARPDHPRHVFGWGRPEFAALLNRCGFEVVRWHADRVTINPFSGRIGTLLTRFLHHWKPVFCLGRFPCYPHH